LLVLLLIPGGDPKADAYARPELLLEPVELARAEVAGKFRILDARPRKEFEAGHIRAAVWVDHDAWSKAFAAGQDAAAWAKRLADVGIGKAVVIYDDQRNNRAARIWWILKYWGIKDVRLLNGGWQGWTNAGHSVSRNDYMYPKRVQALEAPERQRLVSKKQLLDSLPKAKVQIIDTRSEGEFCGTTEKARRNGAIPGARHLEWSDTLDKKSQRFKTAAELKQLFRQAGIDPQRPSATYCQSGGRAAVMAFVLELMGARDVGNYYRSWAEWGNDDNTPITRPKEK
jgi:thiosulfate/3-mercaptopyruvate sulfurtransferase